MNYYNENDPKAAAILRELIKNGHIADGVVDERSIEDIFPAELGQYNQCHFFAGFGLWSLALRQSGWPDNKPVWTGSCPCQPFSTAGKRGGFTDERHLWPAWFHLIQHGKRREVPVYGEQIASRDGLAWLDLICADLEAENYTVRPFDICSAGFGAPIIRQRTYWMASPTGDRWDGKGSIRAAQEGRQQEPESQGELSNGPERRSSAERMGNSSRSGLSQRECDSRIQSEKMDSYERQTTQRRSDSSRMASYELIQRSGEYGFLTEDGRTMRPARFPGPTNGFWRDVDWLKCRDGKWRPVEPGTFPLADGYPERVGILRGYGNAISPVVAAEFIKASQEEGR